MNLSDLKITFIKDDKAFYKLDEGQDLSERVCWELDITGIPIPDNIHAVEYDGESVCEIQYNDGTLNEIVEYPDWMRTLENMWDQKQLEHETNQL